MPNRNMRNGGARIFNGPPSGAPSQTHPIARETGPIVSARVGKSSATDHVVTGGGESVAAQVLGRNAVVSSSGCVQKVVGVPVVTYLNCGLPHLSQVVRIEESTFMQQECRRA